RRLFRHPRRSRGHGRWPPGDRRARGRRHAGPGTGIRGDRPQQATGRAARPDRRLLPLGGVTCTGPSACLAVGGSDRGSLVARGNGTAWHIQPAPTPSGGGLLNGVACPAPAACTAVGFTFTSSGGTILAERWNGTAWHIQPTPQLAARDVSLPEVA